MAAFDAEGQSSDGGLVLLSAVDRRLGLTKALGGLIPESRQAGKVEHSLSALFQQRVLSIAAGYADGNDAARLREDPVLQLACGRDPKPGAALASQPTLSRFERSVDGRTLIAISRRFEQARIGQLGRRFPRARRVVIDLDGTEDRAHGQQRFAFFNGFYDSYCFLPLVGFLTVDGQPEQTLFHARLRPGVGGAHRAVIPLLRRTVRELRLRLPRAKIVVRLDAGFATPLLLQVLEELGVIYVVALPANPVLLRRSKHLLRGLRKAARDTGETQRCFGEILYQAGIWAQKRRVVVKAEMLVAPARSQEREIKRNLRFVVTNDSTPAQSLYEETYCNRGDSENRIKELKQDLEMDRTSSTSYCANQLRVLMTATAYALYQELRAKLAGTDLGRAQVGTLRLALIKLGARVVRSVRRVVLHLPRFCPRAAAWMRLARRLGAAPA